MRWLREGDEGLYFLTEPWKEESLRNGFVKTEALQRNIDCIHVCVLGWVVDSHTLSSSRHKSQLWREILSMNVLLLSVLQL